MGKKLVVSDLDGTLLDQYDGLSPEYVQALNLMIDQGLEFTIATGRDMKKTKKAIDGLKLKYPVILTNGALLADLNTNQYLEITKIENKIVRELMEESSKRNLPPMVFAAYDPIKKEMHFNKGKWGPAGIVHLPPEKYLPFLDLEIVSIQFHNKKEILDQFLIWIQKKYLNQINIIYIEDVGYKNATGLADWYWLEINSIEAGKDNMLRKLSTLTSFPLEDIIVFGDNLNDIDMIRLAGWGIAMDNAPDEVKQHADEVCEVNHHGGVVKYLQTHLDSLIK
jgi:Cof subfamily protein (haloacid dehalogenase superfamily)